VSQIIQYTADFVSLPNHGLDYFRHGHDMPKAATHFPAINDMSHEFANSFCIRQTIGLPCLRFYLPFFGALYGFNGCHIVFAAQAASQLHPDPYSGSMVVNGTRANSHKL
jgi:hypothetical protein